MHPSEKLIEIAVALVLLAGPLLLGLAGLIAARRASADTRLSFGVISELLATATQARRD